jgi:hypothetical protein
MTPITIADSFSPFPLFIADSLAFNIQSIRWLVLHEHKFERKNEKPLKDKLLLQGLEYQHLEIIISHVDTSDLIPFRLRELHLNS